MRNTDTAKLSFNISVLKKMPTIKKKKNIDKKGFLEYFQQKKKIQIFMKKEWKNCQYVKS